MKRKTAGERKIIRKRETGREKRRRRDGVEEVKKTGEGVRAGEWDA